ncbi:hypothetical protein [Nesterenkonia aerolata]|uniref:Head-to-tail stopper n=1 Tax=Nesterenkonia aerolata TaxID=3074079 RepID=A0ABU2DP95_9MICC|nr:hypothetical protein [Nesterenkonia sp. LY-0111]MDR8018206.1 hypothetical protein [Nesterenkonia sp. LY-0111]
MILKDTITVRVATTAHDRWGQPITTYEDTDIPAQVFPAGSEDPDQRLHLALTGRYRVIIPATAPEFSNSSRVVWDGAEMEIEGKVQTHTAQGRPHHREFTAVYRGA